MTIAANQQKANYRVYQLMHGHGVEDYALMTVRECCADGRISPATFYRLAKKNPNFPALVKIGGGTRVRSGEWRQFLASLSDNNGESA
jgi:predicted DNA-binding transcriptional regulator AlpA